MLPLPVIITPAFDAQSRKEESGAFNLTLLSKVEELSTSGMFSKANFENLNLLAELLKVDVISSAEEEKL